MKPLRFLLTSVPISADQFETYERSVGVQFPTDFRDFCLAYNGGCPDLDFDTYSVPDRFVEYREEYADERGQSLVGVEKLYGIHPVEHRFSSGGVTGRLTAWGVPKNWHAVAGDLFGNHVFLVPQKHGWDGLYFWDKDTREAYKVADSCGEFYDGLQAGQSEDL